MDTNSLYNLALLLWQGGPVFGIRDLLDILGTAFLLYAVFILVRRTHTTFIFAGMGILLGIYIAARVLNLYLVSSIFHTFFAYFAVILAIIFQRELRYFFEWVATWKRLFFARSGGEGIAAVADELAGITERLAKRKMGALIVLPGHQSIDRLLSGGTPLGGRISPAILESIFDTTSPGHDGAVIIRGDRVSRFGVHLPLADKYEGAFGTRHRAALGLAERSDALIIIVSEERGAVSIALSGRLEAIKDETGLREALNSFLRPHLPAEEGWAQKIFFENLKEKLSAIGIAVLLWLIFVAGLV